MTVCDTSVVKNLQHNIEHVRMCLFDLVKEDNAVRLAANRFGQLSAFIIANVSRRRSKQTGYRVFLHILGHVDTDHVFFRVKESTCKRFRQFGLADTGRAEENK